MKVALAHGREAGWTIVVPEVVVQELIRGYRRALKDSLSKRADEATRLSRRLGLHVPSDQIDPDRATDDYAMRLRESLESQAVIAPLPAVSHENLLSRDVDERRPFKNGKGYRDTLIWLTVLHEATKHDHVIFMTANRKDFGDGDELHEDLKLDIEGIPRCGKVEMRASVRELVYEVLVPKLPSATQTLALYQRNSGVALADALAESATELGWLDQLRFDVLEVHGVPIEDVSLECLDTVTIDRTESEKEISEDEKLLRLQCRASGPALGFGFKSELAMLDDITEVTPDWNSHVSQVGLEIEVSASLAVAIDVADSSWKISDVEVIESEVGGWWL